MAPVYLLGAGFSRAVSSQMPTMTDLSAAIKRDLRGRNIPRRKTAISLNFEGLDPIKVSLGRPRRVGVRRHTIGHVG